jgi:hypothetical protein
MRIPVDKEFLAKAKELGLPLYRVQIDWRFVPKDKRHLKSHESCGYTSIQNASNLFQLSMRELADAIAKEAIAKEAVCEHKWVCGLDQQQCMEDCDDEHDPAHLICRKCRTYKSHVEKN